MKPEGPRRVPACRKEVDHHMLRALRLSLFVALGSTGLDAQQRADDAAHAGAPWHTAQRFAADSQAESSEELVAVAEAELASGRPGRAHALLTRLAAERGDVRVLSLLGAAERGLGNAGRAGELFAQASELAAGAARGVLSVRAATALEAAGRPEESAARYREARALLPQIADWLALREAGVTREPDAALDLLRRAPPAAAGLAGRARAEVLLAAGDSVAAVGALAEAGAPADAAWLALAVRDTARAKRYAYLALDAEDTATVRTALALVRGTLGPSTAQELLLAGQAEQRQGDPGEALRYVERAAAAGDRSTATLTLWAGLVARTDRDRALELYREAAARGGPDGRVAAYRRARLLLAMDRSTEAAAALLTFADTYPASQLAPTAVYLVAEGHRSRRRTAEADSLYRVVAARWPRSRYAGRARLHLATMAAAGGNLDGAESWYGAEIAARGASRQAASFFLARLVERRGRAEEAARLWERLAREDSLGYYGLAAREAVGLPLPVFPAARPHTPPEAVRATLDQIDLLQAAELDAEASLLVEDVVRRTTDPQSDILDVAEGLIDRGYVAEGVRLGWRATVSLSLHDARVLRAIFPWPFRSLILAEAQKYGLDPFLLAAVIRQESTFRAEVTSRAGARGLMQLMPTTASYLAGQLGLAWDESLLGVADANLHLGAAHLASLLDRYGGERTYALAAYNAGGSRVRRWLRDPESSDPLAFVERIPFRETRGYVRSVLRFQALYRALYPPGGASAGP